MKLALLDNVSALATGVEDEFLAPILAAPVKASVPPERLIVPIPFPSVAARVNVVPLMEPAVWFRVPLLLVPLPMLAAPNLLAVTEVLSYCMTPEPPLEPIVSKAPVAGTMLPVPLMVSVPLTVVAPL